MHTLKGIAAALASTLVSAGIAQAAPQAVASGGASAQEIHQLLDVLGIEHTIGQFNARTAAMIRNAMPCAPASAVQAAFDSPSVEQDQIDRLIPIYQQQFSSADVRGLLAFFRSPLGAKWLHASPAITEQAMQEGRQYNQQRMQQMVTSLQKQGVLDAQGACPAAKQAPAVPPPNGH